MGSLLYLRTRLANIKGKKGMVTEQDPSKEARQESEPEVNQQPATGRTVVRGDDAQAVTAIVEEEAAVVVVASDVEKSPVEAEAPQDAPEEEGKQPRRGRERRDSARGSKAVGRETAARETRDTARASAARETPNREGEDKSRGNPRPVPRRPGSSRQLLMQELPEKASGVSTLLRSHLTGEIGVHLTDRGDHYIVDWIAEKIQVKPQRPESPECMIHLTEQNLLKIASGDLNPQIGMLSDKIKVEGKLSFAVYFFNLLVPKGAQ